MVLSFLVMAGVTVPVSRGFAIRVNSNIIYPDSKSTLNTTHEIFVIALVAQNNGIDCDSLFPKRGSITAAVRLHRNIELPFFS